MANPGLRRAGRFAAVTAITLILLCVAGVAYLANNIKVRRDSHANGDDVSIRIPGGQFSVRARKNLDPATLGVPVYPNATLHKEGGGATFEWTSADGKEDKALAVAGGDYVTSDSVSTVLAWYKGRLPNWVVVTDDKPGTRFELSEGGYKRIVALREKGDGTHIGVATIGEPASN